jgi:drug/metabolite transporter (DMT)-like permease
VSRWRAEAALFSNTIAWGATFVLIKAALDDVSPILFLTLRFSLAALALAVVFRGVVRTWSWRAAGAGAFAGALLFAGYAFQTVGLRFTTAPRSAFLTGLTSAMVPLLGACVYKVRPQVAELLGVLVATAGLGMMTLEGVTATVSRGDVLTLLGTFWFAGYIVVLGHFSGQMKYEILSVSQMAGAALLGLCLLPWIETPRIVWQPVVVWAILITGLVCTALAFTVQAWAQQYTTSTRTAVIYLLEPVFAWIASLVVAGEGLAGRSAMGAVLILAGVLVVELKPWGNRLHLSLK